MCTVTFLPIREGFQLTSNRDEHIRRSRALPPAVFIHHGQQMIYPTDPDASGSWITLKENGEAAVLLNGAFADHVREKSYRRSRGLIFLEIAEDHLPVEYFKHIDLEGIEPFTLIIASTKVLSECRWDGRRKHVRSLDASMPHIWSSATLYDKVVAAERQRWFDAWLSSNESKTADVLDFHKQAGGNDPVNGLVIQRKNGMQTVSITSVMVNHGERHIDHLDLSTGVLTRSVPLPAVFVEKRSFIENLYWSFRKIMIRTRYWEYWPAWLFYGPLLPYWCWLSLKARSLFFFSAANPSIVNAGFVQERKGAIYELIPQRYYPRTMCCKPGENIHTLIREMKSCGLCFPLIAKPEIGQKGQRVELLRAKTDLQRYSSCIKVDFLLQEYIDYPLEAGIFYYRIPGETTGQISGIAGKNFLTVTGDGRSDITTLLQQDARSLLQLSALQQAYGDFLQTILPAGVPFVLVPYGNHARGAEFLDESHRITSTLTRVIDEMCQQIPGFYYGRLDIRFNSWDELAEGKHFSIIELNGAGSEPTHIYDPRHSILFAWKEVCKHWRLLSRISRMNKIQERTSFISTRQGIQLILDHFRYQKELRKQ